MTVKQPHPVELCPGDGHAVVVFWVITAAGESLLCQEDQVILREPTTTVHLCLVLHIQGLTQLRPQNFVWNNEGYPALGG